MDDPLEDVYHLRINRFWSTAPNTYCLLAAQCIAFDAVGNSGVSEAFVAINVTGKYM